MLRPDRLVQACKNCNPILYELQTIADEWQDELDEVEANEPEYESQQDRWQERLDRLNDAIESITNANDNLEQWIANADALGDKIYWKSMGDTDCENISEESLEDEYSDMRFTLYDIIDDYVDVQSNKRGIAKQIKKLKSIVPTL